MSYAVEVYYLDGRVSLFPQTAYSAQFGNSIQDDISFRFDAKLDERGLVIEFRHHEVAENEDEDDPRGKAFIRYSDAYTVLVDPEDIPNVYAISYNSKVIYARVGGVLLNLAHINMLSSMYLGEGESGILLMIADLYSALTSQRRRSIAEALSGSAPESDSDYVARMLNVPTNILTMALDYKTWQEAMGDGEEGALAPAEGAATRVEGNTVSHGAVKAVITDVNDVDYRSADDDDEYEDDDMDEDYDDYGGD